MILDFVILELFLVKRKKIIIILLSHLIKCLRFQLQELKSLW